VKRRFEVALFAVNKQLRAEAKEYLPKKHTLVLVTHKWSGFDSTGGPFQVYGLPVLTKKLSSSSDPVQAYHIPDRHQLQLLMGLHQ